MVLLTEPLYIQIRVIYVFDYVHVHYDSFGEYIQSI